jgi:CRP-like cAMP-binding protein
MAPKRTRDAYESPSLHTLIRRSWEQPRERDLVELLGALPLFARLNKRQLRALARHAKIADYEPGDVIIQKGDRGDSFYLVLDGGATVVGRGRTLGPGEFFGEIALIDAGPRSATVKAVTGVRTMRLPRRAFVQALKNDPQIAFAIMQELAGRVRRLEVPTSV